MAGSLPLYQILAHLHKEQQKLSVKEQEKIQTKYRELNQISVIEPNIIFIGDSIVEYYPLQ